MKNYLLLACLVMTSFAIQAQDNVVKLGLGSAFQRDINVKYERAFGNHHSVQLSFLYDTKLAFASVGVNVDGLDGLVIDKGGFAVTPEYRYYFKDEEGPRGFYLGVYGRYRTRNLTKEGDFGLDVDFDAKINVRNFGGGIGCGVQWLINDAFVIDWYIAGLGFNSYGANISAELNDTDKIDEYRTESVDAINDYNIAELADLGLASEEKLTELKDDLISQLNALDADNLTVKTPRITSLLPELRAGLSVGYAF